MNLVLAQDMTMSGASGAKLQPVLPPLPWGFRPVRLADITEVKRLAYGEHPVTRRRPRGSSAAQKSGLRYQRQVCDELRVQFGSAAVLVGPWLEYRLGIERRYCQPDAIVSHRDLVFVFEVKLSSTTDAWWQLRHLYGPVVQKLYPSSRLVLVNVVKSHYPEIRFPEDTWTFDMGLESLKEKSSVERIVQWRKGL